MTFVILKLEEISLPQHPLHPYTLQEKQFARDECFPFLDVRWDILDLALGWLPIALCDSGDSCLKGTTV